jgi:hypothetical protein
VPTLRSPTTLAALIALVATLVGTAYATGPGYSEVLISFGAVTALTLARSLQEPRP